MGRRKLSYPPEFREEAVRLVRDGGKSIGAVAKDLGIADQSLRNWVKQSDLDAGRRTDGLTTEERAELRRLRRENRVLREEREILKKVVHAAVCGTSERMKLLVGGTRRVSVPVC